MHRFSSNPSPLSFLTREVKWTLILTLLLSFFCIFSNALFVRVFHILSPQYLLSLTPWGIHHGLLWQFISYLFIQPIATEGISFSLLLHSILQLCLIAVTGSAITQSRGPKHFIGLYFGGGILIGAIAYLSLLCFPALPPFAGATYSIYILLLAWSCLFPDTVIMLFFIFPIRAKWLTFGIVLLNIFLDFSSGRFFSFFLTATALTFGYLYSILVWEVFSPFPRLRKMEERMIHWKRSCFQKRKLDDSKTKIHFLHGEKNQSNEEDFINVCLDKIHAKGKNSLSLRERWRLWRIAKKKKQKS